MSVQLDTDARRLAVLWTMGAGDELIRRISVQKAVDYPAAIRAEIHVLMEEIQRELGNWPQP